MYTQDNNGLYPGGASVIPQSMRVATNGTYSATTIGWHQVSATVVGGLIAPTRISLISILIIVIVLATKTKNEPDANRDFDPGEVLHLIAAASAGGMQTQFAPFDELKANDVKIKLASVKGANGRTGFIDDSYNE